MWSKTKKQLKTFLCDSLKGRVDFFCSNYRMHDGIGRAYITVDGDEVYNMCTLKRDYYRVPKEGVYSQVEFLKAVNEYINSSVEKLLHSDNTLIKILTLLDRRIGKRTLEGLKEKMVNEEDIVKYFYKLRCEAEGKEMVENKLTFSNILLEDYDVLTIIMTEAFNEDTRLHTELMEDGPRGYNDGSLIKKLNEHENYENYKILYNGQIVGAFTVEVRERNEYSLEMLFIDPKYREEHLGAIVWKAIEKRYSNAEMWTVETPDYSKRNHHFYTEKCGFSFKRENVYEGGERSFVFEKLMHKLTK